MAFLQTIKTTAVAATLILAGTIANAAPVAEFSSTGIFSVEDFNGVDALAVSGDFSASFDANFDTTEVHDFLFEFNFSATDLRPIDFEFVFSATTGDQIVEETLAFIGGLDVATLNAINAVIDEVYDGTADQSQIVDGFWLGVDVDFTQITPSSIFGTFGALIFDPTLQNSVNAGPALDGDYSVSASLSTLSPVPLPATLPLLAFASAGLVALRRRQSK